MSDKIIPILFAADDNYVKYLYVAILSLLKNKKDSTKYELYILSPEKYEEDILKDFDNLKQTYNGLSINYVLMGNAFDNEQDKERFLPSSSYFYLKIADIIKNHDKAIYLDPDIIVLDDLTELFDTDLGNNYVAGVKAAGYMDNSKENKTYYDSIGFFDISQYINANSLVFNLKLMREDNLVEKLCELSKNAYQSMDQDVLNIVCYNRIKHISFKYNLMVKYLSSENHYKWPVDFLESVYGKDDFNESIKHPVVIHYANVGQKPWMYDTELKEYWWQYAKLTPYYKEFVANYKKAIASKRKPKKLLRQIFSICNAIHNNKKYKVVTIFGLSFELKR